MRPEPEFDLAVVGAGIVGLACALAAVQRGKKVVVIDRDAQANGASVRNFGFITVTGQARGYMWGWAHRSRLIWEDIAEKAGIPILHRGLLMTARRPESLDVIEAFLKSEMGEGCELLAPAEALARQPGLADDHLLGALWSPHELRVESRVAIPKLARWLEHHHGVTFRRGEAALSIEPGQVMTSKGLVEAQAIAVCPGDDLYSLFPEQIAARGVLKI
jgi:FAD dependent oxidoreductase TIGR03364